MWQRIFWAICAGAVAAVLLATGGLQALQTAVIASALPFALVMVFMCYGVLRALQSEGRPSEAGADLGPPLDERPLSWQQRLSAVTRFYERRDMSVFLEQVALPALGEVAQQMRQSNLTPDVTRDGERLEMNVPHGDRGVFRYTIRIRGFRRPSFSWMESSRTRDVQDRHYRALAHSTEGEPPVDVSGMTRDQLSQHVVNRYAHFRHVRRIAAGTPGEHEPPRKSPG